MLPNKKGLGARDAQALRNIKLAGFDGSENSEETLFRQAFRVRERAAVSWPLARAYAGLIHAVPEKWSRDHG